MTKHTEASTEVVGDVVELQEYDQMLGAWFSTGGTQVRLMDRKVPIGTRLVRQSALLAEQEKVRELEAKVAYLEGAKEMLLDRLRELGDAN